MGSCSRSLLDDRYRYVQFDEVWGFIGKKERHLGVSDDPEFGDVWPTKRSILKRS